MTETRDIKLLQVRYLDGPNIWTYRAVIEAWIDIGPFEDLPSNQLPGLYERLTAWLPGMIEHRCGVGERGGFLMRLREGTWAGHILEHLSIELQNLAGLQAGFGKARETFTRGIYKVAFRARNEQVGRRALSAARELFLAAVEDEPFDLQAVVAELRELVDRHHFGPSTEAIIDAAAARGIPLIRLNEGNLIQLGYGANLRRAWTAETDRTSAIAEGISRDKTLTKSLLESVGVPVPEGEVARDPAHAWEIAQDIDGPVVVKPVDGNHARGVTLNLTGRAEVEAAWPLADAEGSDVLVERYIDGDEHRLLIVGDKLVAAARGEIVTITADGRSTISELVEAQINSDPRRGTAEEFPLDVILVDDNPVVRMELQRQGFNGASVPDAGQQVVVQRTGNMAVEVTDQVHPDFAAAAVLAARVVGLDIAGIDLVAQDISRPIDSQQAAIVEVNAGPGLLMHLKPAIGQPRPVGAAIVDHLFEPNTTGRIPVVGVTGSRGTETVAVLTAHLLSTAQRTVGLACSQGFFIGKRRVDGSNHDRRESGRMVLMNPRTEVAVIENGPATILNEGLAYDRCQVGVVTDLSEPERWRDFYVRDEDQLFSVLRSQVDVVLPEGCGVLNADQPEVLRMAQLCDGNVVLFGSIRRSAGMQAHLDAGGQAVCIDEGVLEVMDGNVVQDRLPLIAEGDEARWLAAAVAAVLALGVPTNVILAGLEGLALRNAELIAAAAAAT